MTPHIQRFTLPYKDIFTTVYLIHTPDGAVLFDAASTAEDIDRLILPFLEEHLSVLEELKYVFISHHHRDHSGGLKRLMEVCPNLCIISRSPQLQEMFAINHFWNPNDEDLLLNVLQVVTIPGHTADSCALFDQRTNTLITGDCLQLYGIFGSEDWASNIRFPAEHLQALKKVGAMNIEAILAAHDYHPYGYKSCGKAAVANTLQACYEPIYLVQRLIRENSHLTDGEIRRLYNSQGQIPTIREAVVTAIRQSMHDIH